MRDDVAAALVASGCPPDVATALAAQARLERIDGEWLLVLRGNGCSIGEPGDRADCRSAAERVAGSVAADNAEAVDRSGRGEPGWAVLWQLPERRPRT
jgi:hypothetical protein